MQAQRQFLATIDPRSWHLAEPGRFVVALPDPLPCPSWALRRGAPLLDEAGQPIGVVLKAWQPLAGPALARVRLSHHARATRLNLRADLLAHRLNIAMAPDGHLFLCPRITVSDLLHGLPSELRAELEHFALDTPSPVLSRGQGAAQPQPGAMVRPVASAGPG
jgi:hypothetical protein